MKFRQMMTNLDKFEVKLLTRTKKKKNEANKNKIIICRENKNMLTGKVRIT